MDRPDYCLINLLIVYPEYFDKMIEVPNIFKDRACSEIYKIMVKQRNYTIETIAASLSSNLRNQLDQIYDTNFDKEKFDAYLDSCVVERLKVEIIKFAKYLPNEEFTLDEMKERLFEFITFIDKVEKSDIVESKEVVRSIANKTNKSLIPVKSHIQHIEKAGEYENDQYIIIGARPSVGKTTIIINQIICDIINNIPILFFTLETKREKIIRRVACRMAGVEEIREKKGNITEEEREKLSKAYEIIHNSVFLIDDTNRIEIRMMERRAKKAKKEYGIKKIYIDYLQYIEYTNKKIISTYDKVTYISKSLKRIALDTLCPVICAAQLNRNVANSNREPYISDLKESGGIEQDADIIMLLHDLGPEDAREEHKTKLKIIFGKYRDGPTGEFITTFDKKLRKIKLTKG